MTDPLSEEKYLPLYAQKEAEQMTAEMPLPRKDRVLFLLITPDRMPTECVWLDPYLGMFAVKGREDVGFMRTNQLPPGTLFFNQRYESADKED